MRLQDYLKEVRNRTPFKRQEMERAVAQVDGKLGAERILGEHYWCSRGFHHDDLGEGQVSSRMWTSLDNSPL